MNLLIERILTHFMFRDNSLNYLLISFLDESLYLASDGRPYMVRAMSVFLDIRVRMEVKTSLTQSRQRENEAGVGGGSGEILTCKEASWEARVRMCGSWVRGTNSTGV